MLGSGSVTVAVAVSIVKLTCTQLPLLQPTSKGLHVMEPQAQPPVGLEAAVGREHVDLRRLEGVPAPAPELQRQLPAVRVRQTQPAQVEGRAQPGLRLPGGT